MSKKKIIQIQCYLIIAILFLVCVILALGILLKYQDSQNKIKLMEQNSSKHMALEYRQDVFLNEEQINIFKAIPNEKITNSNLEENKTSILEQKANQFNDLNLSILEQNSSSLEQNLSRILEQNSSEKDENLSFSFEENLSKNINSSLVKTTNLDKNTKKAKLAIIIDDMANASQVKGLKALNLKLNPSFFPPDKRHPLTPKFAKEFDFYMVHLPLAAINYNKPELDTLNPNDSKERIFKKIGQIKKDFKSLKYINNHTGSLFTSNEEAMRKLYGALIKEKLVFVDSKTIGNSKAQKIAKETGEIYIQRDVFLDNEDEVNYIKNQLSNAVKLAQKKGFAIAIGHPRKNTFKALEESKDLLKKVELVYLSEVYGK